MSTCDIVKENLLRLVTCHYGKTACIFAMLYNIVAVIIKRMHICDPSGRNQSHVGRVRFPLRAEMHGSAHITDSCFIAFITSKIC